MCCRDARRSPRDVIHIASIVAGEDFAAERARTMDKMGLSELTREQLAAF